MAVVATLYRQQSPQLFSPPSTRCTSRTPTPPSQREESCPSTWTTWPSGTALTSGDPVGCWCTTETVGRAPLSSLDVTVVQRKREKTTCPSSSSSFRNRSVCHPSRQEVRAEGSKVQARCNDCWRNRFGFYFLTWLWFVSQCIVSTALSKRP